MSVNVVAVTVVGSSARENFARGCTEVPRSLTPFAGTVSVTCGGTGCSVVKLQLNWPASAVPSVALTPVVTVAVYVVANASDAAGVSVPVFVVPL